MSLLKRVEQAQQRERERQAELVHDGAASVSPAAPSTVTIAPDVAARPAASSTRLEPEDDDPPPSVDASAVAASSAVAPPAGASALRVPVDDPLGGAPAATAQTSAARAPVPVMAPSSQTRAQVAARDELLRDIRRRLQDLITTIPQSMLEAPDPTVLHAEVEALVDRTIRLNGYAVTGEERRGLIEGVVGEIVGLGPLEPLLKDDTITEVMVNGPRQVYIERRGKIERVDSHFLNDEHVLRIIDRIITPIGRRIDMSSPRVDARLPDGSRVNAIIPPLSLVGPVITIRKFSASPYTVADLVSFGTATPDMFEFLRACVEARLNLFVSGGTGSGKTTTLNVISSFIPEEERIVTIEDAAELQLNQKHVITLESRPANLEGLGEITIRDLLRNALHMRPDRIIVGECRSGEALDMLQAMTVGHEGSMSTGHANSPADMLRRLETMVLMAGVDLPLRAIREQIASAVDIIVHTARLKDGTRKIVAITEVQGIEDDEILVKDIFAFDQTGFVDGKIEGQLLPTGVRPTFMAKLRTRGIALPPGEYGLPPEDPGRPDSSRGKRRGGHEEALDPDAVPSGLGLGRAVTAGGMVYVTAVGPVDRTTGRLLSVRIEDQTRLCLANLQEILEAAGSSLDKVVWANWSLRDPAEFDAFIEEWTRWFPAEAPVGQGTIMPAQQRRAGFRISLGVIAQA